MRRIGLLTTLMLFSAFGDARADVRMPRIFTNHMVLQQELPLIVFGWADSGEKVSVSFHGKTATATAGQDGRWQVALPAMKADGTPRTLRIQGKNSVELEDVLLGEVWLGVGQSNMSRGLRFVKERAVKETIAFPDYRLFHVDLTLVPQRHDIAGSRGWAPATHESMNEIFVHPKAGPYEFSEVTFYFGKRLHEELKTPIGMISSAMPGSLVQEWTPLDKPEARFDFQARKDCRGEGALYQAMLQGIAPLTIRGAIWYQGESDGMNRNYHKDLHRMIEAWRARFQRSDMPFYMAQIAQTTYAGGMLGIWEAESWIMRNVPNTGLAPSNDLWDWGDRTKIRKDVKIGLPIVGGGDPHPPNKNVIALRLADIALKQTYGVLHREVFGPMYLSHEIRGDRIFVKMKNAGSGLRTDDGQTPNWFEVSGGAQRGDGDQAPLTYVIAKTQILDKDTIEVWSDAVRSPKQVRFAWHPLARHNLYNGEGLPGVSFQTELP